MKHKANTHVQNLFELEQLLNIKKDGDLTTGTPKRAPTESNKKPSFDIDGRVKASSAWKRRTKNEPRLAA